MRFLIKIAVGLTLMVVSNGLFYFLINFLGMTDSIKMSHGFVLDIKLFILLLLYTTYLFGFAKLFIFMIHALGLDWLLEEE